MPHRIVGMEELHYIQPRRALTTRVLAIALALAPGMASAQPAGATVETLKIFVLEGQNAINNVRVRNPRTAVVEIRNSDDQPLEGALVTFELPATGPGGFLQDQATTKSVRTNGQGQAGVALGSTRLRVLQGAADADTASTKAQLH